MINVKVARLSAVVVVVGLYQFLPVMSIHIDV